MLTFARFLLFIIGLVELGRGEWITSYNGIQSIVEWLLFFGSFGLISISFATKNIGRTRSIRWAFYCSLLFLVQVTWCGLLGFLLTLFAIILILVTPDNKFSENIDWYDDGEDY